MSRGSSAARRIEENAPVSTCWRILKAARRAGEISLRLAKAIANFQVHAVDEIARCHSLPRFGLDLKHAQRGLLATLHTSSSPIVQRSPRPRQCLNVTDMLSVERAQSVKLFELKVVYALGHG